MARSHTVGPHDQSSTLRQLKLLVLVLVISNVGLGSFCFYLIRAMDRNYSELLDHSIPILNDLQTLTAMASGAMRVTNASFYGDSAEQRAAAVAQARRRMQDDISLRGRLLKAEWAGAGSRSREELHTAGDRFSGLIRDLVAHYATGNTHEAVRMRDELLRPAYETYLATITKVADTLQEDSQRDSDAISARAGSMSKVVLGLASWPLLTLAALLLLTALFVVVLMVLFRGREMSDMP